MIPVSTTRPASIPAGYVEVFTTVHKAPIENRCRSILIPELSLPDSVPSKFVTVLIGRLYEIAREQLIAAWKSDPALKEVSTSAFTIDGLLAFAAAVAESKRLTRDSIAAAILPFIATLPENRRKAAADILCSMAGNARQGKIVECESLATRLSAWVDADETGERAESPIFSALISRLQSRAAELREMLDATAGAF